MLRKTVETTTNNRIETSLSTDEMQRFESYLEARGAKKGPFLRQMILRLLAEDDAIRSGRTQLDPAFLPVQLPRGTV